MCKKYNLYINTKFQVEIHFKGNGSIGLSNFVPSGTWDVRSGTGHVNRYSDTLHPNKIDTSKTDATFNILVQRKVK